MVKEVKRNFKSQLLAFLALFLSGRNISEKIERPYLQKKFRKNEENPTYYVKLSKFQRKHAKIGHDSQKLGPHLTLFQEY